jgi:hypothetical protein
MAVEPAEEDDHHRVILTALHPVLPSKTMALYLGEGAANILYTIDVSNFTINDAVGPFSNNRFFLADPATGGSVFDGKVLPVFLYFSYVLSKF